MVSGSNFELFKKTSTKNFGEVIKTHSEIRLTQPNYTGSYILDAALGTPIPNGSIIEVYGESGSGKTSLCLEIIVNALRRDKVVGYIDKEGRLNKSLIQAIKGLDELIVKEDENGDPLFILMNNIYTGDDALNLASDFIAHFPGSLLVIDSVDGLVPKEIMTNKIGDKTMGGVAKLMSEACRKLSAQSKSGGNTIIFINQMRDKLNPYGKGDVRPGGKALDFWCDQRIKLTTNKAEQIKCEDTGKVIGHNAKFSVVKNSMSAPFVEDKFPIIYGEGISEDLELADLAVRAILEPDGKKYIYDGKKYWGKDIPELIKTDKEFRAYIVEQVRNMCW